MPPLEAPEVAWRRGIDLSPVDVTDPRDVRWLRACLWPDQPARHARLEAALAVAREHGPVEVRRGDALALLPALIEGAPAGALVCVFHTAALAYFTPEQIADLRVLLEAVERDVVWVGGESPGVLLGAAARRGAPLHFALSAGRPGALERVGRMGHHGGWLEWGALGDRVLPLEPTASVADHVAAAGEVDDPAHARCRTPAAPRTGAP